MDCYEMHNNRVLNHLIYGKTGKNIYPELETRQDYRLIKDIPEHHSKVSDLSINRHKPKV